GRRVAGRRRRSVPWIHGGGQERQSRSGTLDTPAVAGRAVAVRLAVAEQELSAKTMIGMRDRLIQGALELDPTIRISGPWEPGDGTQRLPANAHLRVPDCDGDSLLYLLDAAGVQ